MRREQIAAAEEIISQHVALFDQMIAHGLNCPDKTAEPPPIGEKSLRASEL
jgi:hypothetical protein